MNFCQTVDRTQLFNLLTGMGGIYILYFVAGILHQSIVKRPHLNRFTSDYQICENTAGLVFVPFVFAWIMGEIYNKIFLKQKVKIPHKNSALAAFAVSVATFFSILAIQRTSFPVVIMFQSCSILPVVFIGVFCSRVHDPNLQLGPKKIIVAVIIAAGILTFEFAQLQTKQRQIKEQFIGIIFLLFHFVAQGFLPDLQAQIKVNYKPQPTQMMAQINKWCALFSLIIIIVTWKFIDFIYFMWAHLQFSIDLIAMSIISGFGQFFVYRMIKQFKQHFVPFTISSRKILTATISIIFYGHKTNWIQILGICIVLFTVFVQFLMEISKKPDTPPPTNDIIHELNEQKLQQQIKSYEGSSKSVEGNGNQNKQMQKQIQMRVTGNLNYNKNKYDKQEEQVQDSLQIKIQKQVQIEKSFKQFQQNIKRQAPKSNNQTHKQIQKQKNQRQHHQQKQKQIKHSQLNQIQSIQNQIQSK